MSDLKRHKKKKELLDLLQELRDMTPGNEKPKFDDADVNALRSKLLIRRKEIL